ncbi:hypothetical protein, partial [Escherichia coli]|uniref:hypothetical protein n=1 Tax=Escherichia coli TaxID=562 RepID=UPI001BC92D81
IVTSVGRMVCVVVFFFLDEYKKHLLLHTKKTGKGIPDNWDKLNNKRTNNVYYLSRRTMVSKKSSIKKE